MRKYLTVFVISVLVTVFVFTASQPSFSVIPGAMGEVERLSLAAQPPILQRAKSLTGLQLAANPTPAEPKGSTDLLSLLRDSIWQSVGALLAVVAIVISIVIYLLQKNNKSFGYEIVSEIALLSVAKELEDKVQILFEGSAVQGVHLILLRLSNTGNVPIVPSDFQKDLTITFDGSRKILAAEITEKSPQSIDLSLTLSDTQLIISKSLWNSGDTITIKFLVSEFNEQVQVLGRITGVRDITFIEFSRTAPMIRALIYNLTKEITASDSRSRRPGGRL